MVIIRFETLIATLLTSLSLIITVVGVYNSGIFPIFLIAVVSTSWILASRTHPAFLVAPSLLIIKLIIFSEIYEPLSEIDALNFYQQAKGVNVLDGVTNLYRMILEGNFLLLIEFSGLIYRAVMNILGTDSPLALAYLNYVLIFHSSIIMSRVFSDQRSISHFQSAAFVVILVSPLIGKYSTYLYKEAFVIFLLSISIYSIKEYVRNRGLYQLAALVIVCSFLVLIRPYAVLLVFTISCALFLRDLRWFTLSFALLFLVLYVSVVQFGGNFIKYIVDVVLASVALIGSPNFLRLDNWISEPWLVVESLVLSILILVCFVRRLNKTQATKFAIVMAMFGAINGAVSYQRFLTLDDFSEIKEGSLLTDDLSRKKVPMQVFLVIYMASLLSQNKKRNNLNA